VVPEIVARQALEILAQRAGVGGQFGGALAVGEHQVAGAIAHMHGPDVIDRVQPGAFLDVETAGQQLGLHRGDGVFERGIFAGMKCSCCIGRPAKFVRAGYARGCDCCGQPEI
jgi:hypothetical protein